MLKKFLNKTAWSALAVAVFIATFCISFLAWKHVKFIVKEDQTKEFNTKVQDINFFLENRINTYNNILYSLQGLFAASVSVERNEWSSFVKMARIALYPDIDYVSFVPIVPNNEKAAFTAAFINDKSIRPEGYSYFKLYPEGTRSEYAVIKYAEPESSEALEAYGFDLYTDAKRKNTLEKARDSGEPQISEKISIVPDNFDGFIMSAPIYQNNVSHETLEEKRSTIKGYAQVVIMIESLFSSANNYRDIVFAAYDITNTDNLNDGNLLYASDKGKYSRNDNYISKFTRTETIKIGERTWMLEFFATPGFGVSFTRVALPLVVLIGGMSSSVLLFFIFYLQGKNAEKKIMVSELRYRRLFEAAQDGILILDAYSGKIVDANPFLKALLGYPKEEIIGKQLWEIGVFKNIAASKIEFLKLQDQGFVRYEDLPLQSKDGQIINVEFVSNVYYVDNKKVIQCNIRNISDRKKIEEQIKLRNKSLEDLIKIQEDTKGAMLNVLDDLEIAKSKIEAEKAKAEAMLISIGDGVVATDNQGKIVVINKSAENMLHCKSAQVLGKKFFEVWSTQDNDGKQVAMDRLPIQLALASAKVVGDKYCYVTQDGTKFPVAITVTPIFTNKKVEGAIEVFRDITKETEIDKAKSEFVSLASHQLRTPLGIIKWYLELVREQSYFKNAPQKALSYLEEIYKNNERIISLVRDLLSVSRIDQERVKDDPEPINIVDFINNIAREMNIIAVKRKVKLSLEIKLSHFPVVFIDKIRLREVIENLVINAIEYNIPSGEVKIILDKQNDQLFLIQIKDSGIGISPADQKKLFTKFFRTEKGTVKNTEGSGLGLYVVKSYVEGWGGKVSFESEEDKGTTFVIAIPFDTRGEGKEVK